MKSALKEWMLLVIGVLIIGALIWGAMADRVEDIYERVDSSLSN